MSNSSSNEIEKTSAGSAPDGKDTFSARWSKSINRIHEPFLRRVLHPLTQSSARNPKTAVSVVSLFSVALVVVGLFTNFNVETDGDLLWTPKGVRTVRHRDWILKESGYPLLPRSFMYFVHTDGDNVLKDPSAAVEGLFEALDAVRTLPGYAKACEGSSFVSPFTGESTCEIQGAVKFWNNSAALLEASDTPSDVVTTLSQSFYPDGTPVNEDDLYGFPQRDESGQLVSTVSFIMRIELPETDDAEEFETDAIDAVLALADEWDKRGSLHLEVMAERSVDDEINAAILADIPLVPIVFTIMGIFTALIFSRRNPVQSRGFLGFTAVVSVFFSIMSGYGLMFISGVNFTSMTQLLPFVIFGIGLDDTFVIMGAYTRTDPNLDTLERIFETIEEVGTSITLTTLTSTLAFGLGCLASVPAVYWLCLYAVPTIAFVYLYQLTFFVAAIVMDEKRIAENRRDVFMCCVKKQDTSSEESENQSTPSVIERFIDWYAEFLLQPIVKVVVVVIFTTLLGLCAWSASQLTQDFDVAEVMPSGSYVTDFLDANEAYTNRSIAPYVYFRYVDQSQVDMQNQMKAFVDDLVTIDAIPEKPQFFWVDDFQKYVQNNTDSIGELTFNEQLDAFLAEDKYDLLYGPHIVRDEETGDITASRVRVFMDNVEIGIVKQEIDALEDQHDVTARQPVNSGRSDFAFMTYDDLYQIWEFYAASVNELILTTILGVVSVTIVALLFIPHYTAALFVLPMICILYVDLLGVMQWGGVTIDPVSYVTCVMAIGLLVDFIIHVLLRYYECPGNRHEKTVATLKSMGVSILTGGISTFLGTMPLAFSTSTIFSTIFIAFLGLSTLGVAHGLIVLPVVLSTIGPEDHIARKPSNKDQPPADSKTAGQEEVTMSA